VTELLALSNPFRDSVVQDAWQTPVDITEIHSAAFAACLSGIESAARAVPDSLLIYGPAGSGKTHLLARLQRHLADTARSAPDSVLRCVFSFVRLQTSPQLLWQHLRRRLASDLMRREQDLTQLQRLVAHQLGIGTGRTPRAGLLELRVLRTQDEAALSSHLRKLAMKLDLPRDLCVALEELIFNRNVRDASAWLAGDSLPESVLEQLGLGVDVEEDREEAARHVVTALCRLAGETLPIVFCFDQVESLQRTAKDAEALFRFGRMGADLRDADPNVFLITCLQSAHLEDFKNAVRAADYDRVAQRSVALESLTPVQLEDLVRSRLGAVPGLAEVRAERGGGPFFPLSERFVSSLALERPCVPRRILALAANAFEEQQSGRVMVVPTTAEFMARELGARTREKMSTLEPADTQRIMVQGAELVAHWEGAELSASNVPGIELQLSGKRSVALSLRNEADGRSLTPKLKALLSTAATEDGPPVIIVRDMRLPIAKTALKAREYLKKLRERGVSLLEPSVEALAALDALSSLLSDAKSGDLANQASAVDSSAVLAWLKTLRDEPALEPVQELVEALFGGSGAIANNEEQDLIDLLCHEHVIAAELAAQCLGQTQERLLALARSSTRHCLVLEGPPVLLLDVSGVVPREEAVQ
jgi:AAA domain